MKKRPLYIQILIRLAFLIVPIAILYILLFANYDPHHMCDGDQHRHTMGPAFGFVVFSGFIAIVWAIGIVAELIWRYFLRRKHNLPR